MKTNAPRRRPSPLTRFSMVWNLAVEDIAPASAASIMATTSGSTASGFSAASSSSVARMSVAREVVFFPPLYSSMCLRRVGSRRAYTQSRSLVPLTVRRAPRDSSTTMAAASAASAAAYCVARRHSSVLIGRPRSLMRSLAWYTARSSSRKPGMARLHARIVAMSRAQ